MTPEQQRQKKLKLAKALARARASEARSSESQPSESGSPTLGQSVQNVIGFADALAGEFNEGLLSYFPSGMRNAIKEGSRQIPFVSGGVGSEGMLGDTPLTEAVKYTGMAAPAVVAPLAAAQTAAPRIGTGFLQKFADDIGNFALANPGLYFGGEAASAAAAGAAGQLAENQGAGDLGRFGAEVLAGAVANPLVTGLPRSMQAASEAISANLLPFTEEGGSIRAARQIQERAGGQAQEFAERLAEIPDGVTPAQWIGNERLLAQEARILEDNPTLENIVKQDLDEARIIAQEELRDSFGQPRTRRDWEISVLERVVPEGAVLKGAQTDELLDSAYQSFAPIYDNMKGFDISVNGLGGRLNRAIYSPSIIADDKSRRSVSAWFNNAATKYNDKVEFDLMPSEDLIALRSDVRGEIRKQSKRQNEEVADLLSGIESQLTQTLERGIPQEFAEELQAADRQYRKYKVVEKGIFNAVDENFTPQDLSRAIQQGGLTSQSQYARGANETTQELRRLALGGRSTEEVLGDPRRARLFVRDLNPDQTKAVQADFMNVLFNRAKDEGITSTGTAFLSGRKLKKDLAEQTDTMKALGIKKGEIERVKTIADTIMTMGRKKPKPVAELFEDGPASILQLVAALAGAKSGQRAAGGGLGSGLVMAQYMSNRARNTLANLTSNEAERLLVDATTDPQLYKALLTKNVTARDIKERAQYLESWLLASALEKAQEDE